MNQRKFDGVTVDLHSGRFVGSFDVEDPLLAAAGIDDVVTIIVTARVNGATIAPTRGGELKRVDRYAVVNVSALDRATSEKIAHGLGLAVTTPTVIPVPPAYPVIGSPPQAGDPPLEPMDQGPGRWGEAELIYVGEDDIQL